MGARLSDRSRPDCGSGDQGLIPSLTLSILNLKYNYYNLRLVGLCSIVRIKSGDVLRGVEVCSRYKVPQLEGQAGGLDRAVYRRESYGLTFGYNPE